MSEETDLESIKNRIKFLETEMREGRADLGSTKREINRLGTKKAQLERKLDRKTPAGAARHNEVRFVLFGVLAAVSLVVALVYPLIQPRFGFDARVQIGDSFWDSYMIDCNGDGSVKSK